MGQDVVIVTAGRHVEAGIRLLVRLNQKEGAAKEGSSSVYMREREGPAHEGHIDALLRHLFLRLKSSRPNLNEPLFISPSGHAPLEKRPFSAAPSMQQEEDGDKVCTAAMFCHHVLPVSSQSVNASDPAMRSGLL